MSRAVVLVSGGIDSFVAAKIADRNYDELLGLFVNYGQPTAHKEYTCAAKQSEYLKFHSLRCIKLPLNTLEHYTIKKDGDVDSYRNTVLLSLSSELSCLPWCTGCVHWQSWPDREGYPDCRRAFLDASSRSLFILQEAPMNIRSPLQFMTKADIIKKGVAMGNYNKLYLVLLSG